MAGSKVAAVLDGPNIRVIRERGLPPLRDRRASWACSVGSREPLGASAGGAGSAGSTLLKSGSERPGRSGDGSRRIGRSEFSIIQVNADVHALPTRITRVDVRRITDSSRVKHQSRTPSEYTRAFVSPHGSRRLSPADELWDADAARAVGRDGQRRARAQLPEVCCDLLVQGRTVTDEQRFRCMSTVTVCMGGCNCVGFSGQAMLSHHGSPSHSPNCHTPVGVDSVVQLVRLHLTSVAVPG